MQFLSYRELCYMERKTCVDECQKFSPMTWQAEKGFATGKQTLAPLSVTVAS